MPVPDVEAAETSPAFGQLPTHAAGVVAAAFDLLTHATGELRRGSFYIGALVLGTVGPAALVTWRLAAEIGDLEAATAVGLPATGAEVAFGVALVVAALGLVAASVEARGIALAILAARLAGRPIGLRDAVQRSRTAFWALIRASAVITIPLLLVQSVLEEAFAAALGGPSEPSLVSAALVTALLFAPFAYAQAGVVLGDVGAVEALRRSTRIFRAARGTTLIVALFEFGSQFLMTFALLAGASLVIRIADAVGLAGAGGMAPALATGALILAVVFAFGTLSLTVAAIAVAPQTVAFLALTHAVPGLRRISKGDGRPFRWLPRPMLVGMVVALLALLVAVTTLA